MTMNTTCMQRTIKSWLVYTTCKLILLLIQGVWRQCYRARLLCILTCSVTCVLCSELNTIMHNLLNITESWAQLWYRWHDKKYVPELFSGNQSGGTSQLALSKGPLLVQCWLTCWSSAGLPLKDQRNFGRRATSGPPLLDHCWQTRTGPAYVCHYCRNEN